MSQTWLQMKELGNAQFKNQNYSAAIDYYTRGIQYNSSEPVLYSNRATCFKCLGKYRESLSDYKKAVQLNPRNTKNLKKLASVYIILGNFGEAQILLQKCCNIEPNDPSYNYELNKAKKMVEDYEKIQEKLKDQKWEDMDFFLWDMVSLGYKVNEKLFAQFTVESECNLLKIHANHLDPKTGKPTNDSDGNELDGPFSQGGFTLTVTPGVVYSISENATITAGVALEWYNIGASPVKQDALYATMTKTSKIQIPVVFKVSL